MPSDLQKAAMDMGGSVAGTSAPRKFSARIFATKCAMAFSSIDRLMDIFCSWPRARDGKRRHWTWLASVLKKRPLTGRKWSETVGKGRNYFWVLSPRAASQIGRQISLIWLRDFGVLIRGRRSPHS